ncbi:MAG: hypothetical protein HZA93_07325 [Verrucomicrobia bacterium]|nr:hypothetical protein [Verrucomicrobiota bacterium]
MRRFVSSAAIFAVLSLLAAGRAADSAPIAPGVVELPKFEVTDSRILPQPESWRYASIPGFEVISKVSERETKRFMNDFLLLQEAVEVLMPGLGKPNIFVPTSLILCGRGDSFNRFIPSDRGDDRYRTNSLFFDDPERGAIVVDFALSELQLNDNSTIEADPYRGFYKEYFRHLIRHQMMGSKPPAWFEEGLAEMFSAIDFSKKWVTFGQIGDGFGGGKDNDFNQMLSQRALMPLGEMFARETITTDRFWSAQCYAFVHMCLYGRGMKYQKGFLKFLTRLGQELPSETLFQECFGMSMKDMALELRGYLGFTDHKYMQFTAKKGQELPSPPPFALREATEAEAGRIVGGALRLAGHGEAAHLALIAPYIRGSREPELLAALGLDERLAGNTDRAKKFLEAAMKAKAPRPKAYLELARIRYAAVNQALASREDKRLGEAQAADVLEPLAAARSVPPPMAEIYELAAEVLGRSTKKPSKEDLRFINEGVSKFSRRPVLLVRSADLNLRHGNPEDARNIITFGLKVLPNSPARLALETLSRELPPEPVVPLSAAPAATAPAKAVTPAAGTAKKASTKKK